ncbi:MAG: asparagine synthetase B, partial [Desulfobacteraceae bacterium]|nr:asparagine synthetase B [Desulfobacteraceae bacterium]
MDARAAIALGHRRLSIIDLSSDGHQPMASSDGLVWIVYNGEVYNYVELRRELEKKKCVFRSKTDTEVILNAYLEWGEDCLERFNGMWAFAIVDFAKGKIFCARDRMGIKPFYYYYNNGILAFASEIKQLLTLPFVKKNLDYGVIYDYLVLSMV